jgi:sugar/nucleoside kinase (ribokinase family)
MVAALARGAPLPDAVIAGNAAGSEAVARLGAVGPVEVEGLSTSLAQCPTPHEKEAHQ